MRSDDVYIYDSFSTDNTLEIAHGQGAKTLQRKFDNYAAQRNAALKECNFKNHWVLILDADERVPKELAVEMSEFVVSEKSKNFVACRIRRNDYFMKTWLKHVQASPFYIRLVVPEKSHYEREINEVICIDGPIYDLSEPFTHYPFSKGITHWLDKHNLYSSMEAVQVVNNKNEKEKFSLYEAIFNRDFNQRRVHQKGFFYLDE